MSLNIEQIPLDGPALSRAYIDDYPQVTGFYNAGPPDELQSYRNLVETIRASAANARWDRLLDLADREQDEVMQRIRTVVEGRGVFVATGQQAGLFVSPLLTLYKALTAARLATRLEQLLELPVMPLFSVASEDHDWAEVNHTYIIDVQNQLQRLSVVGPGEGDPDAPRPPVERIKLGADIEQALDDLIQSTPDSEFKGDIIESLREAYRPGHGFAEAFQIALRWLLRAHRFLIVRTADTFIKRESRELLWAEWERRADSEARLADRAEALSAAGFEPQVPFARGATNLFCEGALGRDRLLQNGSGARLRRSGETLSGSQLREMLEESPGRASPGALLRPVAEAYVFPVVAHVGGPAEIAYLAQSQVLFELHAVPAPVVVPRAAFRLVEPKVGAVLEKYGLCGDDLGGDTASAIKGLLKRQTPGELRESLDALRRSLSQGIDAVEAAALAYDPGSRSALGSGKRAIFEGVKRLEGKLEARVREKNQVMQRQLEKVAINLFPNGRPQERVLSPYPYLIRYGESLIGDILQRVETPLG